MYDTVCVCVTRLVVMCDLQCSKNMTLYINFVQVVRGLRYCVCVCVCVATSGEGLCARVTCSALRMRTETTSGTPHKTVQSNTVVHMCTYMSMYM
jgi:hypothetical protein